MKKVYVIEAVEGIHKIFSNPKSADKYLNQVMVDDESLFHELSEPEEYEVEP